MLHLQSYAFAFAAGSIRTGTAEMPGSIASPSYAKVGAATCSAGARLNGGLCTDWWQAVAPAEGPVKDNRLQRRIRITAIVTAADMKPWWTTVTVQAANATIKDATIIALAEHCPALIRINVSYCMKLTDAAIIALAEHCPALIDVNLGECCNLTDAAINALAEHCPALTGVNVSGCWSLTDAALIALAERCPALTVVKMGRCNKLKWLLEQQRQRKQPGHVQ